MLTSEITGMHSLVLAVVQAGWLHLLPSENRSLPALRGEIRLADAIVSTPLARKTWFRVGLGLGLGLGLGY